MIKIIGLAKETAMVTFGILAITSPMFGVFFGGYLSDYMVSCEGVKCETAIYKFILAL